MKARRLAWVAIAAVAALAVAGGAGARPTGSTAAKADKVTLQLKWVTQAQFAGYYAALKKGYYKDVNLDVTIRQGGPDITPEQVVASGQAQFGIDWLPSLLATRDKGGDIVNIAQVFGRSGMLEIAWKDSGINSIKDMAKKKVGVWCCGNEFELFAALTKNGLDPKKSSDVRIVNQPFDMNLFLQRKIDAAAAMTYNELAQVLESKNAKTGKLYQLSDLNIIAMEDAAKGAGTSMLEDGIFAQGAWLKSSKNQFIARRFVTASLRGWIYCRDHAVDCTNIVLQNGPTLGRGHQRWQMNEINALIWPSRLPIGIMDPTSFARTAKIAQQFGVISKAPSGAYRTDISKAARKELIKMKLNVLGKTWKKAKITVTEGGK